MPLILYTWYTARWCVMLCARYSVSLRPVKKVVWGASGSLTSPGETYPAWVRPSEMHLASTNENVVGIALDDYPYQNLTDLVQLRQQLERDNAVSRAKFPDKAPLELYTTFYIKDLNVSGVERFLSHIEHPILWSWSPSDVPSMMSEYWDAFEAVSGAGRMLGLYAYDFSAPDGGALFPLDTMRKQLDWALLLLRAKRVHGIAFEGLWDLDLAAAEMLREWIAKVKDISL